MRASLDAHEDLKVVLGLCNPGEEYHSTYHNVGGLFMDSIAAKENLTFKQARYFEYAKSGTLVIAKSLVYMNESGVAAKEILKYFNVSQNSLIVAHDDSDLTLGNFKISVGQNAAGHHGVESLISMLGGNDFTRARIGIRPEAETTRKKAGDFVLKKINKTDLATLAAVFDRISEEIGLA